VIRFSAALVVAAIGVLIGGAVTSSLLLVYVAIGISALALVVLAVGVALKREELFGDEARSATSGTPERAGQSAGLPETQKKIKYIKKEENIVEEKIKIKNTNEYV